jgi:hypothetical protein
LGFSASSTTARRWRGGHRGKDDALAGGGEVAVEVEGADEGFEGVFQAAARVRPPVDSSLCAEEQAASSRVAGEAGEEAAFGQRGAAAAEHAFAVGGIEAIERLGEDELEHGVAEKFEPLVVRGGGGWSCR